MDEGEGGRGRGNRLGTHHVANAETRFDHWWVPMGYFLRPPSHPFTNTYHKPVI